MESDIRAMLNKAKWDEHRDMSQLRVSYVDRGQPGDCSVVTGDDIIDIKQHFFVIADAMIPFHRVIAIRYGDEVVFQR